MSKYDRILVAVDGSEPSKKACDLGIELATSLEAKLMLVSVIDSRSFPSFSIESKVFERELQVELEEVLKEQVEKAKERGVTAVESFLEMGNPKKMIAHEIPKRTKADLIICGRTGLNRLEKALLGSVSQYVTQYGDCDVLIARES